MEPENLTKEVKEILVKTLESNKGNIRSTEAGEHSFILIDGEKLSDNNDVQYVNALNKLIRSRLIEKKQLEGNIYKLTEDGRKLAEDIQ